MPDMHPETPVTHSAEDRVRNRIDTVLAFWREGIAVASVVVIVCLAYAFIEHRTAQSEREAALSLATAYLIENADDRRAAIEKVAVQHPGTAAAAESRLTLMSILFQDAGKDKSKVDASRAICETFLRESPDHFFAAQVRCEYARLLEWDGKFAEALKQYETAKNGPSYLRPEALLGIGRCQEALNNRDAARAAYNEVLALQNETRFQSEQSYGRAMPATKAARYRLFALSEGTVPLPDAKLVPPETKKPETAAEAKPEIKVDAKADTKTETKPAPKAEPKPEPKADAKPEAKAEPAASESKDEEKKPAKSRRIADEE